MSRSWVRAPSWAHRINAVFIFFYNVFFIFYRFHTISVARPCTLLEQETAYILVCFAVLDKIRFSTIVVKLANLIYSCKMLWNMEDFLACKAWKYCTTYCVVLSAKKLTTGQFHTKWSIFFSCCYKYNIGIVVVELDGKNWTRITIIFIKA